MQPPAGAHFLRKLFATPAVGSRQTGRVSDVPQNQQQPARFEIQVPDELREGAYANFLSVWHTQHDFTLDFAVTDQPVPVDPLEGGGVSVPCRVVSRIRIPATVAEDVLRALAQNVTDFENVVGRIRKPGEEAQRPAPE